MPVPFACVGPMRALDPCGSIGCATVRSCAEELARGRTPLCDGTALRTGRRQHPLRGCAEPCSIVYWQLRTRDAAERMRRCLPSERSSTCCGNVILRRGVRSDRARGLPRVCTPCLLLWSESRGQLETAGRLTRPRDFSSAELGGGKLCGGDGVLAVLVAGLSEPGSDVLWWHVHCISMVLGQ